MTTRTTLSVARAAAFLAASLPIVDRTRVQHADAHVDVVDLSSETSARFASRRPQGVPVAPAPGSWYATVNAWHVQVRGSYAWFLVRVPSDPPDRMPPELSFVRENATVRLDVDADGDPEALGRTRRVTFAVESMVGVTVPPLSQGVGDVTERDERSPGWPTPGPTEGEAK